MPRSTREVRNRFLPLYEELARRNDWLSPPNDCLARIVVLDQFPRNMFRGTARAFAADPLALAAAKHAVAKGYDRDLLPVEKQFVYLPFEHSESLADQERACELMKPLGEDLYDWALRHQRIIERFGRFPHRNDILGRASTPEEIEFLKTARLRLLESVTAPSEAVETSLHVLRQQAVRVARLRRLPLLAPRRELLRRHVELQQALLRVDGDRVALLHERDRAADVGLGRDVADHHAPGAAGEAPVGEQADRFAEALADERRGRREHLLHAGPALRPFVADDEHVARLDLRCAMIAFMQRVLGVEHARRPGDRPGSSGR